MIFQLDLCLSRRKRISNTQAEALALFAAQFHKELSSVVAMAGLLVRKCEALDNFVAFVDSYCNTEAAEDNLD
jgi:hypothetical protein